LRQQDFAPHRSEAICAGSDLEHPLGYGKASYFWSFVVAIMLFSLGVLFSIYEGVHKLTLTEPLTHAWVALLVLGVPIIIEFVSLAGCLREIRLIRGERAFGESRMAAPYTQR
jgi:divalent metal cation (Fe/Co/Zn/Cd) transporter